MLGKIRDFSDRYHMLEKGDRVIAGVSGGADSVCLLLVLFELSREKDFSLAAVHVEHGIRGEESLSDAAFTERLCKDLNIPFFLFSVDVPEHSRRTGQTLEEAARELRYESFAKACRGFQADKIAVAHHAGDNAETMLFHLVRGTGIRGLGGIAPVSTWMQKSSCRGSLTGGNGGAGDKGTCTAGYRIIRPLLCVEREEIEAWLTDRGQTWQTDSTNGDASYSRNRIRRRVLPELEEVNSQAVVHMQKTGEYLREISDFLDEQTLQAGQSAWQETVGSGGEKEIRIFCEPFGKIHPLIQKHLLLQLLGRAAGSRKDICAFQVEEILGLMTQRVGRKVCLPYGMTARRTYDSVLLYQKAEEKPTGAEPLAEPCRLQIPGDTILPDGHYIRTKIINISDFSQKIPKKTYTKWFDYDKIKSAVWLRTRREGDYLQIHASGGHKSIKKYFIEEKIPACQRDRICLLADGDHVMWVIGYRISEAYRVDRQTKRVLQAEVFE